MSAAVEVVWSGTMERSAAADMRRRLVLAHRVDPCTATTGMVRDFLQAHAERAWTSTELADALASSSSSVAHVCSRLYMQGEVTRPRKATYRAVLT
jgi:hypothetical protein